MNVLGMSDQTFLSLPLSRGIPTETAKEAIRRKAKKKLREERNKTLKGLSKKRKKERKQQSRKTKTPPDPNPLKRKKKKEQEIKRRADPFDIEHPAFNPETYLARLSKEVSLNFKEKTIN